MKQVSYIFIAALAMMTVACSNDSIDVQVEAAKLNEATVNVSLGNFFSSYNFNDTKHDIQIADAFRVFSSENGDYIQVRTLFYNADNELVDSLVSYVTNTNAVIKSVKLADGTYTAISTLLFAYKENNKYYTLWTLKDKEKLTLASLNCKTRWSKWSIMSYDSKTFTVSGAQTISIAMNPKPVGALGYLFLQNFQFLNEYNTSSAADNGIRSICLYGRNVAKGFRLNPSATDRFIYYDDAGPDSWYFLSEKQVPSTFDKSWTYFKSNLYDYFYILAPQVHVVFGYVKNGESTFSGYGEATYNITSGQTYLAYWDYFQVGNPYFGIADNSHWHTYSSSVKGERTLLRRNDAK